MGLYPLSTSIRIKEAIAVSTEECVDTSNPQAKNCVGMALFFLNQGVFNFSQSILSIVCHIGPELTMSSAEKLFLNCLLWDILEGNK
mmetsp:Transcript_21102/g.46008  ORF Transcript_21102/g.46008 Transcript_21102/m.46008 type:complete len:87 (+) Transcript_21102:288-548(+)